MRRLSCLFILLSLVGLSARAQTTASCPATPTTLKLNAPNIFNAQQEQDLGDAFAEIEDAQVRFVNDPSAEAYLEKIGQKLLAVLPPTEFRLQFKIVDSWQVNAWSIAGGHIYFTRKLITAAANEDQIAGVLAHEIGHIFIHQQAIETTKSLNDDLHVTSVTDRADVFDKVHRLQDVERNPYGWHPSGEKEEEIADALAVFALMKAGYLPGAYADFWNQVAQTKGKSGSVIGGIFHTTRLNEQRLRGILKNIAAIPAGCATAKAPSVPPEFVTWRQRVTQDPTAVVSVTDDKATQLNPALRSDFTRLQFSPDGKYALAQDLSTIFVLGRSPLRLLFQIAAHDADPAWFSPDSTHISFSTSSLRVEQWDVATQKLLGAHDVLAYQPCHIHLLSPDGHVMACLLHATSDRAKLGLSLWDVDSGDVIVQRDDAFDQTWIHINPGYSDWATEKLHWPYVRWAFTTDSKRLMVDYEATTLVYDLNQHEFVKAGGAVGKLDRKPFAMMDHDRIAINNWDNPQKSAVYSFPEGKELKQIAMGSQELRGVTRGDYLILTPMKDAALGLLDLGTGQVPFTMPNEVLDVHDKSVLMETGEGGVAVTSQGLVPGSKDIESIDLPLSELLDISAATVSPDGKFLAISNKSRSAIWNVETGDRLFYVRPFSSGYFDDADQFYGNFPKYRGQPHIQTIIDPRQRKSFKLAYPVSDDAAQKGDVLMGFNGDEFEVRDVKTNQVLWTRGALHEPLELATQPGSDEMVIAFQTLFEGVGQGELKAHPELMARQKALKNPAHGFLVEVVGKHTGEYRRGVVADIPHTGDYTWSTIPLRATAFGDFALIQTEKDSTVVYRFSTGARSGEVFGDILANDSGSGLFCVTNRDNELVIYDAATVRERTRFMYATNVSFAQFLPERKQLFVLTADQKVHVIAMDTLHADSVPAR
jgi:WD40 repeat protein